MAQASSPAAAHLLNTLANASQNLKRSARRVEIEAAGIRETQGIIEINAQTYSDMLAFANKVNALVEAAAACATTEEILLAQNEPNVFFSA